jgi:hypothetical protein
MTVTPPEPIQPPDPEEMLRRVGSNRFNVSQKRFAHSEEVLQINYGIPEPIYGEAMGMVDPTKVGSLFQGIPVAASSDEYFDAISIFADESGRFMHPDDAALYGSRPAKGYRYTNTYDPLNKIPDSEPALISEVPTSTTNPNRPRTVAAGYSPKEKKITVVFRDGTFYNYFLGSLDEKSAGTANRMWQNFKRARSKGRFIYTYLDQLPRGVADVSTISASAREALYRLSRTSQILRSGYTGKQKPGSKRGTFTNKHTTYRPGNSGGTPRARAKRSK